MCTLSIPSHCQLLRPECQPEASDPGAHWSQGRAVNPASAWQAGTGDSPEPPYEEAFVVVRSSFQNEMITAAVQAVRSNGRGLGVVSFGVQKRGRAPRGAGRFSPQSQPCPKQRSEIPSSSSGLREADFGVGIASRIGLAGTASVCPREPPTFAPRFARRDIGCGNDRCAGRLHVTTPDVVSGRHVDQQIFRQPSTTKHTASLASQPFVPI